MSTACTACGAMEPLAQRFEQSSQVPREQLERRLERTGLDETGRVRPRMDVEQSQTAHPLHAGSPRRTSASAAAARQIALQHVGRHQPSFEQRRQRSTRAPFPELRKHQRHVLVVARRRAADAQRAVERLVHEPRQLGLVGDGKSGIEVGLERKLAQQRQAERVNGADRDVGGPIAQARASARPGSRRGPAAARSVAMMRSRISAAALRVNVIARMLTGSTPARSRLT